jgi:A/G-specific adenine glycosylase
MQELPNIETLNTCDDEKLHKLWEGLGYYSRVRNLKKAARVIMEQHGGVFPGKYEDILALPGIGEYTAGAIASIAFQQPTPAVDGNVLRVVSRLTEDSTPIDQPNFKKTVRQRLAAVYPERAGDFTQSLIELGATLCGPNWTPRCEECPCRNFCLANLHGTAAKLPVKSPKKAKKVEKMTVFLLSCDGHYGLQKRPSDGLLAGLWQFPNVPGKLETDDALRAVQKLGLHPKELLRQAERHHIFTHIRWEMRGIWLEVQEMADGFVWLTAQQIEKDAALPTAFRQFWEETEHV